MATSKPTDSPAPTARELSTSAVACFVFGSIQFALTMCICFVVYYLKKIASNLNLHPSNQVIAHSFSQSDLYFVLATDMFGILSLLCGISVIADMRKGKAGGNLALLGFVFSAGCALIQIVLTASINTQALM